MNLAAIRERLRRHQPALVAHNGYARAAVAMILRDQGEDCDVLLIQRSERPDDPWSGHMALPGGRADPSDGELVHTAARETREEVGIDLMQSAHLLGGLDDVQAMAHRHPLGLFIRPFVFALTDDVSPQPNRHEVHETVWLPLSYLSRPEARGVYGRRFDGTTMEFPAFVYQGYTIWGLTYRMLTGFLEVLAEKPAGTPPAR